MNKYMSLKDHVYNYISERISSGTLTPEEKINEQQISEELDISRTPVREALIQLATEGYLENLPRKGFKVKYINEKKAKELYTIIGALDGLAAFLAMSKVTEKEIKHMKYLLSAMYAALDNGSPDIYFKLQMEFHSAYIDLCGNEELINLLNQLRKSFIRQSYKTADDQDIIKILKSTNDEHVVIVELFEKGNAEAIMEYIKKVHWNIDKAIFESF